MATLDNAEVLVGDGVWSVPYGRGRVTELLSEGKFIVVFDVGGRQATFDSHGVQARGVYRTLFWRDPILTPPLKDAAKWGRIRPVVTALIDAFTQQGG